MKFIRYIISSHYFSIVISFIFVIINITYSFVIFNKIEEKISLFECNITNNVEPLIKEDLVEIVDENKTIFVDIKGEVKKPGVYEIKSDYRVSDVIKLSGGLTKNANTRFINLSKTLKDGDVIVIYSNNEIKNATKEKIKTIYVETPCICEEVKNDACLIENLDIKDPIEENSNNETKNETKETKDINETNIDNNVSNKININSASIEDLKTLTGIGDAKAKAIIEYRNNNGNFNSIEDIMKVN